MPRRTPLYGLPALSPTDRARDIADVDWANALELEAILAQQGQMPLSTELVDLVTRMNQIEARASGTITHNDDIAAGTFGSDLTIRFPAGRFITPPRVTATASNSRVTAATSSVTKDGATIGLGNWSGGLAAGPLVISWNALGA
ncbi:hypothetical protein [Curtobacterium sp. MCBD17_032]|uniref:hypothetical protein n=1 Tax=Curtobacterium sp. MCBD17_032 TaxID=2175659 RepID=UPI000DAA3870|nr:hypothetical protein [Curtobacterium sp. MCBD17_032]PZE84153.1 hypothetical protein DEI91_09670 [Curtobacterium sp. MCBD17_032]